MSVSKMIMGQAANRYVDPVNVENLFSTFLYNGTGSAQTITNNIDLSGEGGLVWSKARSATKNHALVDTVRGANKYLEANNTVAEGTATNIVTAFNSNGYTAGGGGYAGENGLEYVSWTFRKQAKFFDIVTYSGTGSAQTISHNLGSVPGMIIVKLTSGSDAWHIYHRGLNGGSSPEDYYLQLNSTDGEINNASIWNDTAPTDSVFTVGTNGGVNGNGSTYVAYVFAHNNNDGGFGSTNDQDIIKCGSYTVSSTANFDVELGFEPQFVIVKGVSGGSISQYYDWQILDSMRGGLDVDNKATGNLAANETTSESANAYNNASYDLLQPTPTGFRVSSASSGAAVTASNGYTYVYMAIRRGDMAVPTDATKVFKVDQGHASNVPNFESGFPVDFGLLRQTSADGFHSATRLTGPKYMDTNSTGAESSNSNYAFDFQDGYVGSAFGTSYYAWMWKRAPGYFDVVCYTGTGSVRTVSHNLGVAPEMIWVKTRSNAVGWAVYHSSQGFSKGGRLETTDAFGTETNRVTAASSATFSVGTDAYVNVSARTYIAFLFATAPGVSKVGSYTGNGGTQNIDCGFSSGARFVLIKRSSNAQDWYIFDSTRGIVAGNDPYLKLNTTDAEATAADEIDPLSSGFTIHQTGSAGINFSGHTYIFYAIA
ncbi:MAG: hypothetical protein CMA66_04490 [Euryarchaeota archaeon]|nr:hypothetical protein [Euryarchaeota archaeon]